MSIDLKQIDELRRRASVSYSDAKDALEKCNGDMLEALVYLEKNHKLNQTREGCGGEGFGSKLKKLWKKGSQTRFLMQKQGKIIFNVSVNVAVIIGIITLPFIEFIAIGFLIALFTGHRFQLQSSAANTEQINQAFDRVSAAAEDIKERFSCKATDHNEEVK